MSSSIKRYTKKVVPALRRYLPILGWLPGYRRVDLAPDVVAGAISWAVMVPVAMAYAQMAGLPAQAGLYASLASLIAYALFGTSRHQRVLASSTMAVMSAAVVAPLAAGDMAAYAVLSAALALTVGTLLILAGIVKLGFISDFLSKSVVTGFVFGLAITIAVSQAPKLFGVPAGSGSTLEQLVQLLGNLQLTNPWTLAISVSSLAIVIFLRLRYRRIPPAPVVLVYGILVVSLFSLSEHGVSVVGAVPQGLPQFAWPRVDRTDEIYLVIGALGIIFLAVGESLGTARAYAAKYDYLIDPNQELIALGAANVGAGLFQGSLYFLNAGVAQTNIRELAATEPTPRALLIDLGATGDLDVPTMDLLADVVAKLRARGVTLMFAQMRGAVRDRLAHAKLMDVIGGENTFPSLTAGVDAFLTRFAASSPAPALSDEPSAGVEATVAPMGAEAAAAPADADATAAPAGAEATVAPADAEATSTPLVGQAKPATLA